MGYRIINYRIADISAFEGDQILITVETTRETTTGWWLWKKVRMELRKWKFVCDEPFMKGGSPIRWYTYPEGDEVEDTLKLKEAYREHYVRKDIDKVLLS